MFLQPGQKIGVMAPSSYVERNDIEKSALVLEKRGYDVFIHPQTFERTNQSAGTVLQKSLALQGLWQRKDIDAIWFAGGGNHSLPLLDSLNFQTMAKHQKPAIGFSDTTTLINSISHHTSAKTFHAPVLKQLHTMSDKDTDLCFNVLEGKNNTLNFTNNNLLSAAQESHVEGRIIGGNLSLFQYVQSLLPKEFTKDTILFLEDCNEELSHIERSFAFLRQSGCLSQAKALLIGNFSNLKDTGRPFGMTINDIITEHTHDLNIPIITDLPFGHAMPFHPLPIGIKATINTRKNTVEWDV